MLQTATNATTIVLADNHPLVRSGLRMLLELQHDLDVLGEAVDADQARRLVLAYKPDVLVLDLSMPGGSGLDVISAVQRISPDTAVVVLTMQEDPAFARAALRAGARGYVLKQAAAAELAPAIRTAATGGTWLDPAVGGRMATEGAMPSGSPADLTERELDILRLIALGNCNAEIAARLHLSLRTVESHRAHLQSKLGKSSRVELVRYAVDHDLLGS